MKNLIRSQEEQIRKQEAKIARKTHEIQSSPRRNPYILKATAFAGRRYAVADLGEGPGGSGLPGLIWGEERRID